MEVKEDENQTFRVATRRGLGRVYPSTPGSKVSVGIYDYAWLTVTMVGIWSTHPGLMLASTKGVPLTQGIEASTYYK
jgi:hypothetical protein